jgi:adenosylcobinamide-GDP ribazoletransferase
MEKFGGITGDLAGWFLQVCELMVVAAVVVVDKIF